MDAGDRFNAGLFIDHHVEAGRGDAVAVVASDATLTYEGLRAQVNRMAHLLRAVGLRREERVLLVLDDTTIFPVAFLGALRLGAVPVPVSVSDSPDNMRHFIDDSYAEVVVCDATLLESLARVLDGRDIRFLARAAGTADALELDDALAVQDTEFAVVTTHRDDTAMWLYSSGSTGRPKGVVHAHGDIQVNCEAFAGRVMGLGGDDRTFCTTRLYHTYGLCGGLLYLLYGGASTVLLDGDRRPDRILAALRAHQPTVFLSVPALYSVLGNDPDADGAYETVRLCVSSAEPLAPSTFDLWEERFGITIIDALGSTEMLHGFCSNRPGEVVRGTMGRPVPGYELRLRNEAGDVFEGEGVGSLEVRGGSCATFYWHLRDRTRTVMQGEWFATGDRCNRRDDGTFVYVGRNDDMFKVSGLWVSPMDMERVLLEHPAVEAAAVVETHVNDFSRVAAFVQRSETGVDDDGLAEELRIWCRERLHEDLYPHIVRFVNELPRTLNGKLARFRLRQLAGEAPATAPSPATIDERGSAERPILGWVDWVSIDAIGPGPAGGVGVLGDLGELDLEAAKIAPAWVVDPGALSEPGAFADLAMPTVVLAPAPSGADGTARSARDVTKRTMGLLRRWLELQWSMAPTLVVVTQHAVAVRAGESPRLDAAPVWGLVRSAQATHKERFVVVDVDGGLASWQVLPSILGCGEPQVALRDGVVLVPTLRSLLPLAGSQLNGC